MSWDKLNKSTKRQKKNTRIWITIRISRQSDKIPIDNQGISWLKGKQISIPNLQPSYCSSGYNFNGSSNLVGHIRGNENRIVVTTITTYVAAYGKHIRSSQVDLSLEIDIKSFGLLVRSFNVYLQLSSELINPVYQFNFSQTPCFNSCNTKRNCEKRKPYWINMPGGIR